MAVPRPYFPGREFVLHPKDIAAWDDLLKARFPQARYYDEPGDATLGPGEGPPPLVLRSTLFGGEASFVSLVLDSAWMPQWRSEPSPHGRISWRLTPSPYPNATILLGGRIREETSTQEGPVAAGAGGNAPRHREPDIVPPAISGGNIYFRCDKNEPEHMRIAQRALRLFKKIATNKIAIVHYPSLKIVPDEGGPCVVWCGFHALEWCRAAPDRFLDYRPTKEGHDGYGIRPLD